MRLENEKYLRAHPELKVTHHICLAYYALFIQSTTVLHSSLLLLSLSSSSSLSLSLSFSYANI